MLLEEHLLVGGLFTVYWLILFSAGVLIVMALIYIFRRIFTSKPSPPMEEVMETIKEERDGEDIEFAAIAAVIAYVTTPRATVAYVERVQEPTPSLWKISSILNSSRFKEVG